MVRALDLQLTVNGDFSIFQDGGRRYLGFLFFFIFNDGNGHIKNAETRHYATFYRNRSNRGRDIAIFGFFRMDFKIFKFLTVWHAKNVEPLHYAKFSTKSLQSRPTYGDFLIIQDGGRRHLEF